GERCPLSVLAGASAAPPHFPVLPVPSRGLATTPGFFCRRGRTAARLERTSLGPMPMPEGNRSRSWLSRKVLRNVATSTTSPHRKSPVWPCVHSRQRGGARRRAQSHQLSDVCEDALPRESRKKPGQDGTRVARARRCDNRVHPA